MISRVYHGLVGNAAKFSNGGIDYSKKKANEYIEKAILAIKDFPDGVSKDE